MNVVSDDPAANWEEPGVYEVAAGVYRIPLPLPGDGLRAVNVYAIEDGDRLVLVDAGWALAKSRERLVAALGALGGGVGDVERFLITHVHRDHYTQAITLRRESGARVSLGSGEQPSLARTADEARQPLAAQRERLRRCGAAELADRLRAEELDVTVWEQPDEWLHAPVDIAVGKRSLQALPTPGHTRGHLVFLDADAELLFAGDHVLPHITPSIGFEPAPTELALRDYLGSLRLVRAMPDTRLLPAHGPVAPSVHARIDELLEHHDTRLRATAEAVAAGASTAYEAAGRLSWTRRGRSFGELDPFNQMLAVTETEAHLDLLALQGRLHRSEIAGVQSYASAGQPG